MRSRLMPLLALLACSCGGPRPAPPQVAPSAPRAVPAPSIVSGGFDAELTHYAYPYEVHYRTFEAQRQSVRMAYMDLAPPSPNGKTVMLLHGKNFSGAYWGDTIRALHARGFRVLVPDQLGFGKSSKPAPFQFSFAALALYTKDLLDALHIDKLTVVGHSMGGMVATRFAVQYPERVEKLVLVNPIGLEDWSRAVPYTPVDAVYQRELGQTRDKLREYMKQSYFDGQWKAEYEPLLEIGAGWAEGPDKERVAWVSALTYDMIVTQPVVQDFPRVKAPSLLIIGTRDRTALGKAQATPEQAAQLGRYDLLGKATARAIPNAQLIELDGIGHVPQVEAFDPYIRALWSFLETGTASVR